MDYNNQDIDKSLDNNPTKRKVLGIVMSVFDPLGLLSCLMIRGRILVQEIWRSGIGWDEKINDKLYKHWKLWLKDLVQVTSLKIPRCYSLDIMHAEELQLHTFCDSSQKALAAAVYLRTIYKSSVEVALVIAKTKVAPIKTVSIPRLELQAALMGSRLMKFVNDTLEVKIHKRFLWSDSTTVLQWIKNESCKLKQFEACRVGEILENTTISEWFWIPTKLNVTDCATRTYDTEGSILKDFKIWHKGPEFLYEYDGDITSQFQQNYSRLKEHGTPEYQFLIVKKERNHLPDITRFSKWTRLINSTARVLKFIKILHAKKNKMNNFNKEINTRDIQEAQKEWIQKCQEDFFEEEINYLRNGKQLKSTSRLLHLTPCLDEDGIIRLNGRLDLIPDSVRMCRRPIILPSKHMYSRLLLQKYHEKFAHQFFETVVSEIKQDYWVINLRSTLKSVISRCQWCRLHKSKPIPPLMGQLPTCRLTPNVKPFTFTGLDYFGPFQVTVGRHTEKRWGVIFTCMSIRAVHLEIAYSLNTESAIMALNRFINRRGKPKEIYSDNGTNFRGASVELKKLIKEINQKRIEENLLKEEIHWKFIPPGAPFMGGTWERLIRSVKNTFNVILKEQKLKDETMATLFTEIENIINSRPITKISADPSDMEALTPNHFLIGCKNLDIEFEECNGADLRKQWVKIQNIKSLFWKRWTKEYLPTLTKRTKWTKDNKNVEQGDIVIIVDENVPRKQWRLGKILNVLPGNDNRVRVVDIKTKTGIFRRPVNKICKIEMEDKN